MTSKWLPPVDLRQGGNGQVVCELISAKCELVSESGSEHFQEEESYVLNVLNELTRRAPA
jgi:hypothetical protein